MFQAATYFVRRPSKEKKPFGLYSGGPGVSFSFDPICSNPAEPLWQQFSREYNELAIHRLGANASPIQTQWLKKGDVRIPRKLAKPRFTHALLRTVSRVSLRLAASLSVS